ncbi:MAG TPA: VOC family protein [Bryobacteraceae bacterium]|jgi:catechol 2,3-dioxygenase-like lactoylglutathione lyase family enzyme|nr:VOC family protein [Bryobacteraceae bacterium]
MITNFRHAGIVVSDMDSSLRFYRDLLGFEVRKQMDESGSYIDRMLSLPETRVTTCKMASPDGVLIELLQFHSHPRKPRADRAACDIGPTHIALTVADLEKTFKELTSAGVAFNAPPQLSPDGYARVTFCKDPDGSLIELVEVL